MCLWIRRLRMMGGGCGWSLCLRCCGRSCLELVGVLLQQEENVLLSLSRAPRRAASTDTVCMCKNANTECPVL